MKTRLLTSIALLLALPTAAQEVRDTEQRLTDLEKKLAKLAKAEAKKDEKAEEPKDGGFNVKYGGRVHLDSVWFSGGKNMLPSGTFLRRARISFKANLGRDWVGEGDVDFAESSVNIKDMWVGYQGFKDMLIQAGQFKQPFGMDTLTSSNNTWLMERSYSDIWTPERHVGVGFSTWGERWQTKVGFFGQNIDDTSDAQEAADSNTDSTGLAKSYKITDNHGYGAAARVVFLPLMISDAKLVHLGVAVAQRKPNAAAPGVYAVDLSGRPEQNKVSRAKFVNASVTNVDKTLQYGAEIAGLWGPFSWQGEYQQTKVMRRGVQMTKWDGTKFVATSAAEQAASVVDHDFSTYYGQVSWIFGGQRTYEISDGYFKSVKPFSKRGAFEVVLRYSVMNQDDLTVNAAGAPLDQVKGGKVKNLTAGLTYYVNKSIRFMLNHTKVDPNENSAPSSAYSPTGKKIYNDDFAFTSVRMQINF